MSINTGFFVTGGGGREKISFFTFSCFLFLVVYSQGTPFRSIIGKEG